MVPQRPELVDANAQGGEEADEEHDGAEEAEHVHRLLAEGAQEPQRQQVEIAVDEAVQAHELRLAVFACLMVHHLLANLVETGILGQIGDIAVHLAIHLDVLHHITAIGLQAAVEVVQVLDTTHLTRRGVEELGGQRLRDGVVAFLLVARDEVVAIDGNHPIEFGYLVGRVLKVGIHCDDDIALRGLEATEERRTLAIVAAELDALDMLRVASAQLADDVPRMVGTTVVDKDHLIGESVLLHHALYPRKKLGYRLVLVVQRHHYGNICLIHLLSVFFLILFSLPLGEVRRGSIFSSLSPRGD